MENELKKLKILKKITLSEHEKNQIRSGAVFLISSQSIHKPQSLLQRSIYHGLRIALSSLVFLLFVTGAVSAVADKALPGDPLYAFKLNFNEEISGLFKNTTEEKVAFGAKRVETRVKEIKTLADTQSLTKAKQITVQKAINSHIQELSNNLATLSNVSPSAALAVTSSLEENLRANKITLENSDNIENKSTKAAVTTVSGAIQKVSNQEIVIISKEIDAISEELADIPLASTIDLNNETDKTLEEPAINKILTPAP